MKEEEKKPPTPVAPPVSLVSDTARSEALKSAEDIYQQIVMDEVNEELLKSAQKCEGEVIVMLVRQERLKGFSEMWRRAHLDFYQTQKNRRVKATLKEAVKASEATA